MKYFEQKIGNNGAHAKFYFQEPNKEIDVNRKYPTIVVLPGGAFMWTSFREDEPIALRFLAEGFNVVVAHYATDGIAAYAGADVESFPKHPVTKFPNSIVEVAKVLVFLRENAEKYAINPDQISVMGFSAGGTVAGMLGVFWNEPWMKKLVGADNAMFKPNSLMIGYGAVDLTRKSTRPLPASMRHANQESPTNKMFYALTGEENPTKDELEAMNPINHVSSSTPPTFLWHTQEDPLVPVLDSVYFAAKLEEHGVPFELHVFTKGKHGLALGDYRSGVKKDQTNAQVFKWVDLYLEWLAPRKTIRGGFYEGI